MKERMNEWMKEGRKKGRMEGEYITASDDGWLGEAMDSCEGKKEGEREGEGKEVWSGYT